MIETNTNSITGDESVVDNTDVGGTIIELMDKGQLRGSGEESGEGIVREAISVGTAAGHEEGIKKRGEDSCEWRTPTTGWRKSVKDSIKDATGKWTRVLLGSNLGRRWIRRAEDEGHIPRQLGDYVSKARVIIEDIEWLKGKGKEYYAGVIASTARGSGYRFVLKEGAYENEIVKGTDNEVEIVLDTGKMEVRMYRGNMPGIRKRRQYKEVAETGESFIGKIHNEGGRTQEIRTCVAKGDAGGLH